MYVPEMETEHALQVIKKQKESRVSIQKEVDRNEHNQQVALTIAHKINNFVGHMKEKPVETDDVAIEGQEKHANGQIRLSLPTDFVAREIPGYYEAECMGTDSCLRSHHCIFI